jgi:uncharacterized protein
MTSGGRDVPDLGPVRSPCTSVCVLDPARGWCTGCHRTLDEIAGWGSYSEDEKRAVLARLAARRQASLLR